jgi:hypothetical protein
VEYVRLSAETDGGAAVNTIVVRIGVGVGVGGTVKIT